MSVILRLTKTGTKKKIRYRVVAADSRMPRDGRFLEILGTYNPQKKENSFTLKEDKIIKWLSQGALPSETVKNLLKKSGLWKKFKTKDAEKAAA